MQIRIANRQDEKRIVPFIQTIYAEEGWKLDLDSRHADLKNVEVNFFGRDGAFLLAEEEEKIIGVAFANMVDQDTCALRGIYVEKDSRGKGVGRQLLSTMIAIARRLQYRKLIPSGSHPMPLSAEAFLIRSGFQAFSEPGNKGKKIEHRLE